MSKKTILVTNDDGIYSEGIKVLAEALEEIGEVWIVAPQHEQSAVGHSLTLHRPLRIHQHGPREISVDGTPTDCVVFAVFNVIGKRPDLLVSGINKGGNMGHDITYSGTVSAAWEGTLLHIPSFAVSLLPDEQENFYFEPAAAFACRLGQAVLKYRLPANTLLNVNVPNTSGKAIEHYKVTRQGKRFFGDPIVERVDPRGKEYYWIGGPYLGFDAIPDSDLVAVHDHYISITPILIDLTSYTAMESLRTWQI
ncbi:MAG TPA: 5'/3'-nucleotidase SurE [Thermodesulfobacteriota bacterium]|nr:5'/3'-nucleotidase SurE [Thermodesulfobacteriota bacterium]HNU70435.1 5'/3'-nucleotidase SurE [Thermodesulfobacteriota bacterium]HQO78202.1 5'/3'-nucleotidase SurE [Thermodesulfobacteriota bacterium]